MKYLLKNMRIYSGTNSRGVYRYIVADLFNDTDIFANPARLPRYYIFTERVIDMYDQPAYTVQDTANPNLKTVNEVALKKAIDDKTCPIDILHVTQIFSVSMPLPCEYGRIYRSDVTDKKTGVIHKAGDFIIPEGQTAPTIVTSVTLYIKKAFDNETNELTWTEHPETVLRSVLERSYRPLVRENAPIIPASIQAPAQAAETAMSQEDKVAQLQAQIAALTGGAPAATPAQ